MEQNLNVKNLIKEGKWIYADSYQEGLVKLNYYISKNKDYSYRVSFVNSISYLGYLPYKLLKYACLYYKMILNLFTRNLGDKILNDLIEEIDILTNALNHNIPTYEINVMFDKVDTSSECLRLIQEDILKREQKKKDEIGA